MSCFKYYFAGFLRFKPDGSSKVSLVLSHNFGLATIEEGYLEDQCLKLKSTSISRIDFSKEPGVTELQRTFQVVDDSTLWQTVLMATTKTAFRSKICQNCLEIGKYICWQNFLALSANIL